MAKRTTTFCQEKEHQDFYGFALFAPTIPGIEVHTRREAMPKNLTKSLARGAFCGIGKISGTNRTRETRREDLPRRNVISTWVLNWFNSRGRRGVVRKKCSKSKISLKACSKKPSYSSILKLR